jgi:hypothetical protein
VSQGDPFVLEFVYNTHPSRAIFATARALKRISIDMNHEDQLWPFIRLILRRAQAQALRPHNIA